MIWKVRIYLLARLNRKNLSSSVQTIIIIICKKCCFICIVPKCKIL